ncbi:MAG: DNA starvation/stationary phase protection protein Dps [Myxococcales bacterium]|nr:DNA starvation/stationary phase protection protein Dps [Myxococcales bacterium]
MNLRFPSHISLSEKNRSQLVDVLNAQLANALDLWSQLKQAHWNLRGRFFISRHELFDALAEHLQQHADDLAERASALGGYAQGTVRLAAHNSTLEEHDLGAVNGQAHVQSLVARYAAHSASLRIAIGTSQTMGDPASEDLLSGQLREVEKDMWFLESHLAD